MNERELFIEALSREPVERAAFLDQACGANANLRARIEELFAFHDSEQSMLERRPEEILRDGEEIDTFEEPASGSAAAAGIGAVGMVIAGRYALLEVLGEGGMGTVYRALQTEPVKREVAVKLIKAGRISPTTLARFDAERQALALMNHPHIARVYDGGTTEGGPGGIRPGIPYFVMDLVRGVPITQFCDEHRLSLNARLELFVQVCQAVQHAHQKGIIHRDLKPNNVLVTLVDGQPTPTVIDFGVAKATEQPLTDRGVQEQGLIVGTLEYMSPEQADPGSRSVDTRSDVYALGILLYELLTGSTPRGAKEAQVGSIQELFLQVGNGKPQRPSLRLRDATTLADVATHRGVAPARLPSLLSAELDCIVRKCLEKEPDRRYQTAYDLARDVLRYLANEPVEARPSSAIYRARKFLARNRGLAFGTLVLMLTLVGGIIGTSIGLTRADAARGNEQAAREQAQKRLAQIETFNELLASIFQDLDPTEVAVGARPLQAILAEKLDRVVQELHGESIGDPLLVATMQMHCGSSLVNLGEPNKAVPLLEKALTTQRMHHGPDHRDTLSCMALLSNAFRVAGKRDQAVSLGEETLRRHQTVLGSDHPDTLKAMNALAQSYLDHSDLRKALPLFEETLELAKARLGTDDILTLAIMNNLAIAHDKARNYDLAIPLLQETLRIRGKQGLGEHPKTLLIMHNLARVYGENGNRDLESSMYEEILPLQTKVLGRDHFETLACMSNLAVNYRLRGQLEKAISLNEESLKRIEGKLGRDHPFTLRIGANLGICYKEAGRIADALPLMERAYFAASKYPDLYYIDRRLRDCYIKAGMKDKAAALAKERNLPPSEFAEKVRSFLEQTFPLKK